PPPPPPEEDTGDVTGTVSQSRKAPIAGATVSWSGPESGSTTTDAAGSYLAAELVPGTYTFTASASACRARSAQVTVSGGSTTTQDFRLRC
ncbi:MAG TPA: carboxypeptidase-like regulatory domain-containing protein, partial [Actinomycetota bacterium]|nr:carboxypeptidase-like regulatory domain-containing protein [Actinomycetota bacterium]